MSPSNLGGPESFIFNNLNRPTQYPYKKYLDPIATSVTTIKDEVTLLKERNKALEDTVNNLSVKLAEAEENIEKFSKQKEESITKETDKLKRDILTIMGLFVAVITFTSAEIKVFDSKNINGASELAGIMLLLLGAMILMPLVIVAVFSEEETPKIFKRVQPLFQIDLIIFILSFLLVFL